jgi:hypothetical protein
MKASKHPTIGFLSTWSVYGGTTIDSYTHTLLRGIYAAAHEQDCNLLIGCGISRQGEAALKVGPIDVVILKTNIEID